MSNNLKRRRAIFTRDDVKLKLDACNTCELRTSHSALASSALINAAVVAPCAATTASPHAWRGTVVVSLGSPRGNPRNDALRSLSRATSPVTAMSPPLPLPSAAKPSHSLVSSSSSAVASFSCASNAASPARAGAALASWDTTVAAQAIRLVAPFPQRAKPVETVNAAPVAAAVAALKREPVKRPWGGSVAPPRLWQPPQADAAA
mmetsp:Transcript_30760/g.77741  ORF Transcript_30760/g.77741 Transcript_30760/m.77741 type:complete len:205 (-) Transcript_30760:156-770(-)